MEYNNFIGSGWVDWEEYKDKYYKRWPNHIGFIDDYPTTRAYMFREKKDD